MKNLILFLGMMLATTTAFGKGKIQNEDVKTLTELTNAGGSMSQLINDTKVYVTANGINSQLSTAITNQLIGGSGGSGQGFSVLVNPGFETGIVQGYTSTGGTFASVNSGSNLLIGNRSATFQASGSNQFMASAAYVIPNGLKGTNCAVGTLYKGGDANLSLQAYDGTNILASVVLNPVTTATAQYATFVCPSSGSFSARVISSGASALVALDQMFLGQNNLIQVAQAQQYGSVNLLGCVFSLSSGSYINFPANGSCTASFVGNASSPGTVVPGLNFVNAPPGYYKVIAVGGFRTATGTNNTAGFTISDGTTNAGEILVGQNANNTVNQYGDTLIGQFHYTTAKSNLTFQVQGRDVINSGVTGINAADLSLNMYVEYFPDQTQLAVRPETINWKVDATIEGSISLSTGTVGSFTGIEDASLSLVNTSASTLAAQIPCSGTNPPTGLTCGAGNPSTGVSFQLPAAGSVKACVSFTWIGAASTSIQPTFEMVETPNNAQTVTQAGPTTFAPAISGAPQIAFPITLCNVIPFSSAGQKTLRLFYEQLQSGGSRSDIYANNPFASLHWTVSPVTQNVPAPVFVGSVTSPSAGVESIVRGKIDDGSGANCTSSPCTINKSVGILSATRTGQGNYHVTFTTPFSDNPTCVLSGAAVGNRALAAYPTTFTNSSVDYITQDGATALDSVAYLICIGPK